MRLRLQTASKHLRTQLPATIRLKLQTRPKTRNPKRSTNRQKYQNNQSCNRTYRRF